ncbi:MAG: 4Fe-4S double cluster binding domain-containing protein [Spirochaetales bacterium]
MKDFLDSLEEEAQNSGLLPPKLFRYRNRVGFITGLYHGRGGTFSSTTFTASSETFLGKVGAFAQNNYYKILVKRLKHILHTLQLQNFLPKEGNRIFCNSSYPEKHFAYYSGLGQRGKNSLILVPGFGSFLVLGGILFSEQRGKKPLPDRIPEVPFEPYPLKSKAFPLCGTCRKCQEACPTGALEVTGHLNTLRCLQTYASHSLPLPRDIQFSWGNLFYGCDICQEACPYNTVTNPIKSLDLATLSTQGFLGSSVDLVQVLDTPIDLLKKILFRSTVLDVGWISPFTLKRSALLALKHQGGDPNPWLATSLPKGSLFFAKEIR